jgi:hypothetical protein
LGFQNGFSHGATDTEMLLGGPVMSSDEVLTRYKRYMLDLQLIKALHAPLQFDQGPLHY